MFAKLWQNILFLVVCSLLLVSQSFALNSPYEGVYTWLPSATRTATTASADIVGKYATGVEVICNVSAASDTGGLVLKIQGKDQISGNYYDIAATNSVTTPIVIRNIIGANVFNVAPSGGNVNVNTYVPWTWRLQMVHGDSSNYTYSCAYTVFSSS